MVQDMKNLTRGCKPTGCDAPIQAEPQTGLAAWILTHMRKPLGAGFLKFGKARTERRMELVEVLPLGGKRQLMMVVCDGHRYLVGAGSDSVQSIAEIGAPLPSNSVLSSAGSHTGIHRLSGGMEYGF
jgi:flagellar biogenesis protein FliO